MKDDIHDLTLADVLRAHAASRPAELGAVCGGYRLDFVALDRRVNQLANALAARGIGAGDRLLWLGQNCHRLLEGLLAAAKLGAVFCPANWRQSAAEFVFVITDSDPAVVFFQEAEIGDVLRQARADSGSKAAVDRPRRRRRRRLRGLPGRRGRARPRRRHRRGGPPCS